MKQEGTVYEVNGYSVRYSVPNTVRLVVVVVLLFSSWNGFSEEEVYSYAKPGRELVFPRDHGSHPDFKIEWWYITGHLFDNNNRRFGFESTFFRLAQEPGGKSETSAFGDSQIYMAHMALSDIENGKFYHEERLNREGWNAFARVGDLDVRNGNWSLRRSQDNVISLVGSVQSKASFSLKLRPRKKHVIFGEEGVSRKGRSETAASYYITWTRLDVEGDLRLEGRDFSVTGSAWMDHEISSSQLDEDQTGWDWVSVQFDDGRELMAYMLRLKEGGYSEYSKLVWIDRQGNLVHRNADEVEWKPGGEWKSAETGAIYPISPEFSVIDPESGERRTFLISPLMENQEMTGKLGGVPYWEGACDVVDRATGKKVGRAYLELAGYVDGLNERLR